MSVSFANVGNLFLNVQKHYLSAGPLNNIDWEVIEKNCRGENAYENQDILLNNTVLHPLNKRFPVRKSYERAFLKHLVNLLEDVNDGIYEQLAAGYVTSDNDTAYVHFFDDNNDRIVSIRETISCISNGTTGLSIWPAARLLADYCLENREFFRGKNILELGSGTGYTGTAVIQKCEGLSEEHNQKKEGEFRGYYRSTSISVLNLPWEEITDDHLRPLDLDVILAADVVYDPTTFPALVKTLLIACRLRPVHVLFACAIRNEDTFEAFMRVLYEHGGHVVVRRRVVVAEVPLQLFEVGFGEIRSVSFGVSSFASVFG